MAEGEGDHAIFRNLKLIPIHIRAVSDTSGNFRARGNPVGGDNGLVEFLKILNQNN